MTVRVSKPAFNIREALNSLRRKIGIKGGELMAAETAADAYAVLNPVMYRNRIINGDMRIDQRNAGASVNFSSGFVIYPTVDRWNIGSNLGNSGTIQQVSDAPAGFTNSVKITSTGSFSFVPNSYCEIGQRVEGNNVADFGWGTNNAVPATLSFYVKSSVAGQQSGYVFCNAYQYCFPFTYTVNATNTWERKTVTITAPTTGSFPTNTSYALEVGFTLGSGSLYQASIGAANTWNSANFIISVAGSNYVMGTNGATIQFTGVQLEKGTVATPFEFRPYGTELALCQRYYQRLTANSSADIVFPAALNPGVTNNLVSYFPCVTMRSAPTTSANTTTWGYVRNSGSFTTYSTNGVPSVGSGATAAFVHFYATVASGLTSAGLGVTYIATNNWIDFSAEL